MLLKKYAQVKAQEVLEELNVECGIFRLCKFISEKKQLFTQYTQTRPFGVSFIYAGIEEDKYKLFSTDPSGTINEWYSVSFGENEDNINNGLRNDLPENNFNMEQGTFEIFKILSKVTECGTKDYKKYEILHFQKDNARYLSSEEIKQILENISQDNLGKN
ncbi:proteasome alpha 3 subunit [Vairimorpha apis BRL 01]|uniref:Proteasome alpha 3 subunit n=1 Tax=Vairimorpha apis BRL 01 TaxID=1037528 RepID=T0ML32_9MICR|nr:proteasome alpha 3 subunit [Vairimorpha apis BRL 01]